MGVGAPQLVAGGIGAVPAEPPVPHGGGDAGHVGAARDRRNPVVEAGPPGFHVVIARTGQHACRVVHVVAVFGGRHATEQGVADVGLNGLGFVEEVLRERTCGVAVAITEVAGFGPIGLR